MKLNTENLESINSVTLPTYDRSKVTPGIVHIGVGGFHRAHQARYLDDLLNQGEAFDFGIVGVGLLPFDQKMKDALVSQDYLYTLLERDPFGNEKARVIGSIIDYIYAPENPTALIEKMASPEIKIVSLTITEGGYNFNQITGEFIADNPDIVHDLAHLDAPKTAFAFIYNALKLRKERGLKPFAVMSCDNVQDNGHMIKLAITSFAKLVSAQDSSTADIADFIENEVSFPPTMVDRITPKTTDTDIAYLQKTYDIEDDYPVICEDFIQWVIKDDFSAGRPAYEHVGVEVVANVVPYELMKLRLLNASHQCLAHFGQLVGDTYVDEAASDPLFKDFLMLYMNEEATHSLDPLPIDLTAYKQSLLDRFTNIAIKDTLFRLSEDTSNRIPKMIVPVVNNQLAHGGSVKYSAAAIAAWAKYCELIDDNGNEIKMSDPNEAALKAAAAKQKTDKLAFIRQEIFFGNLAENEVFAAAYLEVLEDLYTIGARKTLEKVVSR
ncbi:MAG: mannitol dehydrogenase family protein [Clostridiales Family XIII bacterium]|jgi:mannitol 2-dehydrogenase|nr:mannitol dehydrogenase family protein [Clostridiales Family XIII bacterium]